jgi:hypothetical protein
LPNISTRLRAVIAAREGYRCWLCERKIDRRLKHPHPRSLSLDHYIPVTKGGSDDPNNLRPAHLICNVRRAAAPPTKSFQLDLDLRPMRAPVIRNARQRRRAMGAGFVALDIMRNCLPEPVRAVSKNFWRTPPHFWAAPTVSPDCVRAESHALRTTKSSDCV